MFGYEYHPAAETEYHEAIRHYSRIRVAPGMAFVCEVERAVEHARRFPNAHSEFGDGLRRVLTRRFPFLVAYEVREHRIFIWAVAHTRREPGYWKGRL